MADQRNLRVHHELVVYDVLDGEVLAIRNDTGTYYSLAGTAADIWVAVTDGRDQAAIVRSLEARYDANSEVLAKVVGDFLAQLAAESLVVPDAIDAVEPPADGPDGSTGERSPFEAPELQIFTDMQDLLLFDPIHEVTPAGWPNVEPPAAEQRPG